MAAATICSDFGAQGKKVCHCFHCLPFYLLWGVGTGCHDLHFWMLSFKPAFSLSCLMFIKRLFRSSSLSAINVVSSTNLRLLIFLPACLIPCLIPAQPFTWCTLHDSEIPEIYSPNWKLCHIGNILQEKPHCELDCKGKPCLDWLAVELVPERWIRIT